MSLSARHLRPLLPLAALWCVLFATGWALDRLPQPTIVPTLGPTTPATAPFALSAPTLMRLGALLLPLPGPESLLRIPTTLLLHVDALHLSGSLCALFVIACTWPWPRSRSLWPVLLLGGCLAACGSIVVYSDAPSLSVGPSGALCAALAAALCAPKRPLLKLLWLALVLAFLIGGSLSSGDQAAHITGLIAGALLGLRLRLAAGRLPT